MVNYEVVAEYIIEPVFRGEIQKLGESEYFPLFQIKEEKWEGGHKYSSLKEAIASLEGVVINSFSRRVLLDSIIEKKGWLERFKVGYTEEGKTLEDRQ